MSKDARYQPKGQLFPSCSASWRRQYLAIWDIFLQVAKIYVRVKTKKEKQNTVEQSKKVDRWVAYLTSDKKTRSRVLIILPCCSKYLAGTMLSLLQNRNQEYNSKDSIRLPSKRQWTKTGKKKSRDYLIVRVLLTQNLIHVYFLILY